MLTENAAAACLLLMAPDDNCMIARTQLPAGTVVEIDGAPVTLAEAIQLRHKVARRALRPGDRVLRYGAPIGTITAPVAPGAHIHTHNLASDYIPTYTLAGDGQHFFGDGPSS